VSEVNPTTPPHLLERWPELDALEHTIAASDVVETARWLALQAYRGQVDKQDRDYYAYHLRHVADLLVPFGPMATAAGWLHDIIEDTPVLVVDLVDLGFPGPVVDAVINVTRVPGEDYMTMVRRAAGHPLARLVKLADNHVNLTGLDLLAMTVRGRADAERLRPRYIAARAVLEASLTGPGGGFRG
jgi:(p)ppGpp synthase/HD superfamily hydrolase